VVLNNQPQGGLAMRAHPTDVVARRNSRDDNNFGSGGWRGWGSPYGYGRQDGYGRQGGGNYYYQQPQGYYSQPQSWW